MNGRDMGFPIHRESPYGLGARRTDQSGKRHRAGSFFHCQNGKFLPVGCEEHQRGRAGARCLTLTNWARDCRRAGRYTARHHDVNKFHRPTAAGDVGDDGRSTHARTDNAMGAGDWAGQRRLGPNTTWPRSMIVSIMDNGDILSAFHPTQ